MTEKLSVLRPKILQMRLSEKEMSLLREAARKADTTVSDYGRKRLLTALLDKRNLGDADRLVELMREREGQDTETLTAVQNFQRLFCEAMELSLDKKLTVARFRGLVQRRSA